VSYSGDSNFAGSTSTVLPVVVSPPAKVNTNTSVSASSTQIIAGASVTLTAKVAAATGSTVTPTGTITFLDSSASVGTATLIGGAAQITLTNLAAGTHSISASYSGDSNFTSSTSTVTTITVEPAPAPDYSFSLSSSALSVTAGASGKLSLTVTPENGFKQAVSFGCSGLPAGASCSFSPQSVTPSSGPVTTALTVQVPQAKMAALNAESGRHPSSAAGFLVDGRGIRVLGTQLAALQIFVIAIAGILAVLMKPAWWRYRFIQPKALTSCFAFLILATVLILGGCASFHTMPTTGPVQSYTITVTASGTNSPTHSQSFTLTIQP
jgi:hypothetical protein